MSKLLFGIVWFVGLYVVGCMATALIAGAIAGVHLSEGTSPAEAQRAGEIAATRVLNEYGRYILAGAVIMSAVGSAAGVLPGTKTS